MATIKKTVRFYDAVLVDDKEARKGVEPDFWSAVISAFAKWDLKARSGKVFEVDYFGRSVSPKRPALPHLQIERIRDLAEQLNRANVVNGEVEPLDFDDPADRVSEPTYLVPFGAKGRVAIMSPAVQGTRSETLSRWLTLVLGLVPKGYSLELTPVVDPEVLKKINDADGAVMLEVHVDAGAVIPETGGGPVGDAFRNGQHQSLDEARMLFRWSLSRSGGTQPVRDALRKGALWVVQHKFSSSAKVKLADLDEDGRLIRDEVRDLFMDRITKQVEFHTSAGTRASEEAILTAIGEAIREFNRDGAIAGLSAAGVSGTAKIDVLADRDDA